MLDNLGVQIPNENKVKIYLAPMGEMESEKAFELVSNLRKQGVVAETDHVGRGIKAQFKYADKIGAEFVGVIGSFELEKGVVKLKNMVDGTEQEIPFDALLDAIKNA
jgi:histidyl-tRNA synthetase